MLNPIKPSLFRELLSFICVIFIWFYVNDTCNYRSDFLFSATNFIIVIISFIGAFNINSTIPYSSNQIFYLFNLFFFGFAPLYQFNSGIRVWGGAYIETSSYILTNIVIILTLFFYWIFYDFFYKKDKKIQLKITSYRPNMKYLVFFSTLATCFVFWMYKSNLTLLIFRNVIEDGVKVEDVGLTDIPVFASLIFKIFIRPIPVIILIIFKLNCKKNIFTELILIILLLLSNFPISLARFYVAALYLPLIILYFKQYFNKINNFGFFFLFSILVLFPFLNQGRSISKLSDLRFTLNFNMFGEGHFDAYINFVRVIDTGLITFGNQLLGVVFFFVPRSIFTSKAIGSGGFVAKELDLNFDHISMTYFAEGYLNFGYFGIFVFIVLISFVNARLDRVFYLAKNNTEFNFQKIIYLLYIGLLIFILRGDLISGFAFTIGIFLSVYFIYFIINKKA